MRRVCFHTMLCSYLFISHNMITRPRRGPRGTTRRRQAKFSFLWNFMANIPWPTSQTTAVHYSHAPRGSWDMRTCAYRAKICSMRVHHARPHAARWACQPAAGHGKNPRFGVCAYDTPVACRQWQWRHGSARPLQHGFRGATKLVSRATNSDATM